VPGTGCIKLDECFVQRGMRLTNCWRKDVKTVGPRVDKLIYSFVASILNSEADWFS